MNQLLGCEGGCTVWIFDAAVLGDDPAGKGVDLPVADALAQNLAQRAQALGQLIGKFDADGAGIHAQPVIAAGTVLIPLQRAGEDAPDHGLIELAPDPHRRTQGDQVTLVVHQVGAVVAEIQVHLGVHRHIPVGHHPDAVGKEIRLGRTLHARPAQLDLRPGVGEQRAQGKGIDGGGDAIDGIGGDVADAVILGHGSGDGAGDELRLKNPPVIGADAGIGLIQGAAEEINLGIFHRRLQDGVGHLGHRGKHHLRPLVHRLLDKLLRLLRGVALEIAVDGDLVAHHLLQIFPALVVPHSPAAGGGAEGVDKGHIQMIRQGDPAEDAGLGILDFRGDVYRRLGGGHDIRPEACHALFQLRRAQGGQAFKGIQLQPQQQRLLRQDIQLLGVHRSQRLPEVLEAGIEAAPLLLRPYFAGLLADQGKQLSVILGVAELDSVDMGGLKEVQKFIVCHNARLLGLCGHHPLDHRRNPRRIEIAQDADTLVALLHVEIA